jgi:hypothetical protein
VRQKRLQAGTSPVLVRLLSMNASVAVDPFV